MNNKNASFFIPFLLISIVFGVSPSFAADHYSSIYPIEATPFDSKLASIGFFENFPVADITDKTKSPEELFQIARSFRYVDHGAGDHWQSAQQTSNRGSGNCADKAVWLYTQLRMNGYSSTRLFIGKYRSVDKTFHVWVVYTDVSGTGWFLDPTLQRKLWKTNDFGPGFYKPLYSFEAETRYRVIS